MYVLIICIYIYIYIYIYNQFLLKSSYTEKKQVSWFLIFFEMSSASFIIKNKVKFCDCYKFVCLFEIQGQILWLIHCRDWFIWNTKANSVTVTPKFICLNVWKLCSAICQLYSYKVKFLNKKLCSMNCGWLKETFWQYMTLLVG